MLVFASTDRSCGWTCTLFLVKLFHSSLSCTGFHFLHSYSIFSQPFPVSTELSPIFTYRDIRQQNQRLYNLLPESSSSGLRQQRLAESRTNRLMASLYSQVWYSLCNILFQLVTLVITLSDVSFSTGVCGSHRDTKIIFSFNI